MPIDIAMGTANSNYYGMLAIAQVLFLIYAVMIKNFWRKTFAVLGILAAETASIYLADPLTGSVTAICFLGQVLVVAYLYRENPITRIRESR